MIVLYRDFYKLAKTLSKADDLNRKKFKGNKIDAEDTIFLHYPKAKYVRNKWEEYPNCRQYFWYHKRGQRNVLAKYFDIPPRQENCEPPYIIRPVRHFGGRNFYVADSEEESRDIHNSIDNRSYGVGLFRRTREFRAFFVGGKHIRTMLKALEGYGYAKAENMPDTEDDELQLQPWNRHQIGTRYLTITRSKNDKLLNTSFYDDAEEFLKDYNFDIIAVDAAYNDHNEEYAVFETNFAPQCTVETTIRPIMQTMQEKDLKRFSTQE